MNIDFIKENIELNKLNISPNAKALYFIYLQKNEESNLFENSGKHYFTCSVQEAMNLLNCSKATLVAAKKCLIKANLIRQRHIGLGHLNHLYMINDFKNDDKNENEKFNNHNPELPKNSNLKTAIKANNDNEFLNNEPFSIDIDRYNSNIDSISNDYNKIILEAVEQFKLAKKPLFYNGQVLKHQIKQLNELINVKGIKVFRDYVDKAIHAKIKLDSLNFLITCLKRHTNNPINTAQKPTNNRPNVKIPVSEDLNKIPKLTGNEPEPELSPAEIMNVFKNFGKAMAV